MKYLLTLNRFDLDKNILIERLRKFGNVKEQDNRIILDGNVNLNELRKLQEINEIYTIHIDFKELKNYQDFNKDTLDFIKKVKGKSFFVKVKFLSKIPISGKSVIKRINSLLKKESLFFKEENADINIYIEFKKENDKISYRICEFNKKNIMKFDFNKFIVVLERPGSVIEISDFLRLCWIFKIPLYIIQDEDDNKFQFLFNKAKKMTKGIPYEKMNIKILKELPKDFVLVGFSKNANLNEKDLINVFNNENKKIALVFGDEKFGLTQEARDKLNYCIHLTSEMKKPLRASHALSYVLGFYVKSILGKNLLS